MKFRTKKHQTLNEITSLYNQNFNEKSDNKDQDLEQKANILFKRLFDRK